jgi:hypothetical protein
MLQWKDRTSSQVWMIAAFFLVVTQMNMSRTARSAKQNESSMYANLASPGERSLVRLLDAAQHESDATPGGGGLEIDHRREDVNVVVEREHVPRLAEAVVHLVEPDAAPVGDRHGAVVQRHVNRAASASLGLPHHGHRLRQRRRAHDLAGPIDARRVHARSCRSTHIKTIVVKLLK